MQPLLLPSPDQLRETVRTSLSSIGLSQFYEQKIQAIEDVIQDRTAALQQLKENWKAPYLTPPLIQADYLFRKDITIWNYALHHNSYKSLTFMIDWLLELYAVKDNYAFTQPNFIQFNKECMQEMERTLLEEYKIPDTLLEDIDRIRALAKEQQEAIRHMKSKQQWIEWFMQLALWTCLCGLLLGAHLQYICNTEYTCTAPETAGYSAACAILWGLIVLNFKGSALWDNPSQSLMHLLLAIFCVPLAVWGVMPLLRAAMLHAKID